MQYLIPFVVLQGQAINRTRMQGGRLFRHTCKENVFIKPVFRHDHIKPDLPSTLAVNS